MKKKYQQPMLRLVLLKGQAHLLSASNPMEVNNYQTGTDFMVGDEEEE